MACGNGTALPNHSESESGVAGAPTPLPNAQTYAQLAVAARIGARRYGHTGLPDEPGTVLLTPSGAVSRPVVIEVPTAVPLRYVLQLAGAPPLPQDVLTGGYHSNWIDALSAFTDHLAAHVLDLPAAIDLYRQEAGHPIRMTRFLLLPCGAKEN